MIGLTDTKKLLSLVLAIAAVAVVWLVILPAYARQPAMTKHLQWLDDQGIDPSAMYYTELEVMEQILQRQRAEQLLDKASDEQR
ncbi:hypothetical protein Poly24_04440 [Rosistilla carotiformis]|uniref:Uncharacterized protein n=1 Tax=Rosistilla carotiformis TaxID=2528017 RepID=A0A518JMG9_9BACT|nr:hypothetical protein [Rosistilla carotiformis]QDV66756.1 hypothetical protein Poly24_04440 [Rosistilla carotiformis]